jgi:putative flavoprotein involved in K+ transport
MPGGHLLALSQPEALAAYLQRLTRPDRQLQRPAGGGVLGVRREDTAMTQTAEPTTTTADDTANRWFADFEAALKARDVAAAAGMFATESYWRDLVSFTWNLKTVEGREGVSDLLEHTLESTDPSGFVLDEPADEADGVVTAWFRFETAVGRGRGLLRLVDEDGPKAFTFLTDALRAQGPRGAAQRAPPDGRRARRQQAAYDVEGAPPAGGREPRQHDAAVRAVVGGGQGGIALGSRLRQLGVPSLVIDKHPRPGDQWRNRYKSLCLHDPVWYDHLPYLKFPENWPVFSPKDKIGDWLESYVRIMEVPYWSSTTATSATWNPENEEWVVEVEREGQPLTLRPKQLVLATGMSGKPNLPDFPGMDVFKGDQHHSSAHPGPDAYAGKKVRRRRQQQLGVRHLRRPLGARRRRDHGAAQLDPHRAERLADGPRPRRPLQPSAPARRGTTEKADLIFASLPYRILHRFQIPAYEAMAERDKDFYQRLEASGFEHDWGDDGSGCS